MTRYEKKILRWLVASEGGLRLEGREMKAAIRSLAAKGFANPNKSMSRAIPTKAGIWILNNG